MKAKKKEIKIHVLDVWSGFDISIMAFYQILKEQYDVTITKTWNDADYVFFSCFGNTHWNVTADKIKIFFTAENITPDFNTCDYAIGFDWLDFGDRYLRLSNYYSVYKPRYVLDREIKKDAFCSFVVSNSHATEYRVRLFNELCKYKKVDSGGRHLNNIGGPIQNKLEFDSSHKFSICCENSSHPGYTTEKLYQAFEAGCIPIYWGDPVVGRVFNTKAFVYANEYKSIDDVVKRIIEIDSNQDVYNRMLNEPTFINPDEETSLTQHNRLRTFLFNIFDQDLCLAYRYNRHHTDFNYTLIKSELAGLQNRSLRYLILEGIKRKVKVLLKR